MTALFQNHSFLVRINVFSLCVVGGMGRVPSHASFMVCLKSSFSLSVDILTMAFLRLAVGTQGFAFEFRDTAQQFLFEG